MKKKIKNEEKWRKKTAQQASFVFIFPRKGKSLEFVFSRKRLKKNKKNIIRPKVSKGLTIICFWCALVWVLGELGFKAQVLEFRFLVFRLLTSGKVKGWQGEAPENDKNSLWVKNRTCLRGRPKNGQNFGWRKNSRFSNSSKKRDTVQHWLKFRVAWNTDGSKKAKIPYGLKPDFFKITRSRSKAPCLLDSGLTVSDK